MRLPFFTSTFVARLRESAEENASRYCVNAAWIETFANGQPYFRESNQVVDPPPALLIAADNNPQCDAENARRVFSWLERLTPALAMEERLWAYLTHCIFPEYMNARWPVNGPSAVRRRFLFEGSSFAALSRNGIARLWWAGHLTKDESRKNPFELTETLFMRQDIQVSLLERSFGKCKTLRAGVLDFLRVNRESLADDSFGRRIQILIRELNLLGGVAILDALTPAAIQSVLDGIGRSRFGQGASGDDTVKG